MKVKLLTYTPGGENLIATAGRVCYSPSDVEQLQESITPEKVVEMIGKLGKSGHTSTFEHVSFTFAVEGVSRALTHQLVRTRIASYSQKSQRYVKEKQFNYVVPETIEAAGMKEKFEERMKVMQEWYSEAVAAGIPAEDARFYLPNAAETTIIVTMNARSLMNFFKERLCLRAQWEIRALAEEMYRQIVPILPTVSKFYGPHCHCTGKCTQERPCGKFAEVTEKYKNQEV